MARALALKDNPGLGEEENVKWQTLQVSTLSIASCIGRILIGIFLSECLFDEVKTFCRVGVTADFANHKGMRRAQCLSAVTVTFLVSQLVGLRIQNIEHLQYAVILVGISYGGVFGLLPTIIIDWFGMGPYSCLFLFTLQELTFSSLSNGYTAHFSENWGLVSLSPLVMGNIFSMVFGRIFDAHSSHSEHGTRCSEGARCYSASLYMTAVACICAFALAVVAGKRDQKYR